MENNAKTPGVNFLKRQQSILVLQSKRLAIISSLSVFVLIFYSIGLAVLVLYVSYLSVNLKKYENDIEAEKIKIAQMAETREKYFLLKEKMAAITSVSFASTKHQDIIEKIFDFFPEGMEVAGIAIKESGEVNFKVTASNMKMVDEFLTKVRNERVDAKISIDKASVSGFAVNESGQYSFGVNFMISSRSENS